MSRCCTSDLERMNVTTIVEPAMLQLLCKDKAISVVLVVFIVNSINGANLAACPRMFQNSHAVHGNGSPCLHRSLILRCVTTVLEKR